MIEPYLTPNGWRYVGDGWSGWDFERSDGSWLEVKQSAANQTWSAPRNIQTRGAFDIAARTGYFHEGGLKWANVPGRCAQTYLFAWNPVYGADTDHRNPEQWEFYIVAAALLPEGQRTIGTFQDQAHDCLGDDWPAVPHDCHRGPRNSPWFVKPRLIVAGHVTYNIVKKFMRV